MNDFERQKKGVMGEISRVIKTTVDEFNEREEKCGNNMFVAATTVLGILFAFSDHIKNVSANCGWCVIVSVIILSLSLILRLIDFALTRNMYRRYLRMAKKMLINIRNATDIQSLYDADKTAADLLNDEKEFTTSSIPLIIQMLCLVIGVVFSAVALIITMVS